MININPNPNSLDEKHHTSYLKLKPEKNYVQEFWRGNVKLDRCWIPWDWCEVKKIQNQNNSIVIFQPNDDTIHAVKADYNHLFYHKKLIYLNFLMLLRSFLPLC